jgi:hypothetical protein
MAIETTQQEVERLKWEAKIQVNSWIDWVGQQVTDRVWENIDDLKIK